MKRMARRIMTITPLAVVATWLVPGVAHAGLWSNHNETLVRPKQG